MHPGDALVEHESVGEDGAGHAPSLFHVGHAQQPRYVHRDGGAGLAELAQQLRCSVDACLKRGGRRVYGALRDGYQANHVGDVLDGALQPAGLREALDAIGGLGEDAVGEAGRRQGGAQVVSFADVVRVAEGDGGLDDAPVGGHFQPEAGLGLRFDGARRHVLGLDHHRRTAGRGDDDVGA